MKQTIVLVFTNVHKNMMINICFSQMSNALNLWLSHFGSAMHDDIYFDKSYYTRWKMTLPVEYHNYMTTN